MKVREIMSTEVYCALPSDTVADVAQQMKRHNIGAVPVCERDKLVGIITDRDLVIECVAAGLDPRQCQVSQFMTAHPISLSPDTELKDAAEIMAKEQIRRLPVVENSRLVGIISLGDVACNLEDDRQVASTLRRISLPIRGAVRPAAFAA